MFDLPSSLEIIGPLSEKPSTAFVFLCSGKEIFFSKFSGRTRLGLLGAVIKIPPPSEEVPYAELRCNDEDKAKIYTLITTMAKHGKVTLLVHYKSSLEQLGRELRVVHPLKFLATMVLNPEISDAMKKVLEDYFKKKNFIDGITPTLDREALKGRLAHYLEGFSSEVNMPSQAIEPYFINRDWNGFIEFLFRS